MDFKILIYLILVLCSASTTTTTPVSTTATSPASTKTPTPVSTTATSPVSTTATSPETDNTMRDILIGVSVVGGVAIIGLTTGLICVSRRNKSKKSKDTSKTDDSAMKTFNMTNDFKTSEKRRIGMSNPLNQMPLSYPKMDYTRYDDDDDGDADEGNYSSKFKSQSVFQNQGFRNSGMSFPIPKASITSSKPANPPKATARGYDDDLDLRGPNRNPYSSNLYNSQPNSSNPYNSNARFNNPYSRPPQRAAVDQGYGGGRKY